MLINKWRLAGAIAAAAGLQCEGSNRLKKKLALEKWRK
jgi:hypothetical protein